MTAKILECIPVADTIESLIREHTKKDKINKRLAIIHQNKENGQQSYIKNIIKHCDSFNTRYDLWDLKEKGLSKKEIFAINDLYDSIICVKPFLHDTEEFLKRFISNRKDVDDFTDRSLYTSCTAEGVLEILKYYNISTSDKLVLIIGRNEGDKIVNLLSNKINNATTIKAHSKTPKRILNLALSIADVIITSAGKPNILNKDNITKDKEQIIIDVGRGDISEELYTYDNLRITPRINGTGLITTLMLMKHIIMGNTNIKNSINK